MKQTAVITGAGAGIGRACAGYFATLSLRLEKVLYYMQAKPEQHACDGP